jgi:UDP-N-acetylglucosamine--N-acetylmuramyl-(pentapeptide) pyrophosphoryl-undecaprenol N-acetylglucosamine transferase
VAAWLCRRPLLIHEQNAIAGFTNRALAHIAREVLTAFPDSFDASVQARVIGNPVRREIASLPPPAQRFATRGGAIRLLVVGGSLGATRLNSVVPAALAHVAQHTALRFEVRHQAGERWADAARASYAKAAVEAQVSPFIADIAEAYEWADLVVCRAGALTISELAAAGLGAILVPFPAAVDDHQTHNAAILVRADAAVLIADRDLGVERLADELQRLCAGRGKLLAMAERARLLARPQAAEELLRSTLRLADAA